MNIVLKAVLPAFPVRIYVDSKSRSGHFQAVGQHSRTDYSESSKRVKTDGWETLYVTYFTLGQRPQTHLSLKQISKEKNKNWPRHPSFGRECWLCERSVFERI